MIQSWNSSRARHTHESPARLSNSRGIGRALTKNPVLISTSGSSVAVVSAQRQFGRRSRSDPAATAQARTRLRRITSAGRKVRT